MAGLIDDEWLRGVLAAQQAGLLNFPPRSNDAMQMMLATPQVTPREVASKMGDIAHQATEFVRVPANAMRPNPYPPGSEEAMHYENVENDRQSNWGAGSAYSEVFWPRMGGAGQVTSGASYPPRIMGREAGQAGLPELAGKNVPDMYRAGSRLGRPDEWMPRQFSEMPQGVKFGAPGTAVGGQPRQGPASSYDEVMAAIKAALGLTQ